jgi:hypothetical protein
MTTRDEILSQRTDLSTFLVHFNKQTANSSTKEVLKKILTDGEHEPPALEVNLL